MVVGQHLVKPFLEFGESAQNLRLILLAVALKPLSRSATLFNLNIIIVQIDESVEKNNQCLGVNATLRL